MSRQIRENIEAEILHLQSLDLDGLCRAWRAVFGKVAAAYIPKSVLQRMLAYRLQAESLGDLSRSTVQILNGIARGTGNADLPLAAAPGGLRPGTVLVREHDGERHHVMVVPDGFAWNGETYLSLSKVAYAITGTKWNGRRFFGLREKQP